MIDFEIMPELLPSRDCKERSLRTVALLEDLPRHGLVRGQVGTVVEQLSPGVYEAAQLLVLRHDAVETYGN